MTRDDLNVCLNRALKFYMTRTRVGSEDSALTLDLGYLKPAFDVVNFGVT